MGQLLSSAAPAVAEVQVPKEEPCEIVNEIDLDAIYETLRPIVPRSDSRVRRRNNNENVLRPRHQERAIVGSDDETDPDPTRPQPRPLRKLRRFKVKTEGVSYGYPKTFSLMEDSQNKSNSRRWKRHLPSKVILKAVLEHGGVLTTAKYKVFLHKNRKKYLIGTIKGPGWLDKTLIVRDVLGHQQAMIWFEGLALYGRNLMSLQVQLPRNVDVNPNAIVQTLRDATNNQYNLDIFILIAQFLTPDKEWTRISRMHKVQDDNKVYKRFHNKVPTWNPDINAYTLEFGGRALLPSVHNFQLVVNGDNAPVCMQVGKLGTIQKCTYFNCDADDSLSKFHAFAITVAVLQRTFINE